MKKIYALLVLALFACQAMAQAPLLEEHFNYPADSLLQNNGWFSHSAGTTNPIRVRNGGLSWTTTPYLGSGIGNAAAVNNTGSDENRPFSSSVSSGNVYISFLMRVNGAVTTTNAGFFLHTGDYANPTAPVFTAVTTAFRARTFIAPAPTAAQYKLGLEFNLATTSNTTTTNLDTGVTYLVVVKYQFVPGANNDSVSLYVFTDGSNIATEPAVAAIGPLAGTAADAPVLQYLALRQYNATQNITVDGIIVQTAWNLLPRPAQTSLPITWDDPTIGYLFTDFGGNASTLAPSPTDSNNQTLRTEKTTGAQTWAGTTITPTAGLPTPIPFAVGATSLSVKVYSPAAGVVVRLKAEQAGQPTISVETEDTTSTVGWETLVFNFSNQSAGTAPLNLANTYNVLSIFYGFGTVGTGTVFFADSVFFGGGPILPPPPVINLPITWDDLTLNYVFTDFGGNVSTLAPSPTDSTNRTLRTEKTTGAQTWAGTTITPPTGLTTPIPFAVGASSISVKVFTPAAGTIVRLKAEQAGVPTVSVETEDTTTIAGWETLVFNFANPAAGTAPLNIANTYNVLSIFYGFGTAGTGTVYFADSVFFGGGPVTPPSPAINLPITWDNPALTYSFTDFGGNASALAPSPTDSTNTTLRSEKTAGAQTWAGTTITPPVGLGTPIPFATGATSMTVKVHAPASGIVVRLKAEQAGVPTISVETEATTTSAGWQNLVFNFANQATGTAPINFANTYNMLSIFYDFGSAGTGAIFYADSVFFGGAPVGPPPVPVNLPITWDNPNIPYSFTDFGGNVSAFAPSPTDTTNRTLRSEKTAGAQTWAGTTITPLIGLGTPIPFAANATTMTVKVHAPASGIVVRLKAEQAGVPTISVETEATTTTAGWQNLVFNFANQATGTAPLNFANTYNLLSIFYDFGNAGTGAIFYADSVFFGGNPVTPPQLVAVTFRVDMSRENISANGVHIAGNFQGWNPSATPMTHQGNGIYTHTAQLAASSTYEFKFINGNQWGPGFDESVPAACAQNNNRFVVVGTSAVTTPLVCFGRCEACGVSVFEQNAFNQAIQLYPNPAQNAAFISYNFETPSELSLYVYDLKGQLIAERHENEVLQGNVELNTATWANGLYYVRISNGQQQVARKLVVNK